MANTSAYAYHPPDQATAYDANTDVTMEREPPNMDAFTRDVVRDQSRLGGARALPDLKERGT